MTINQVAVDLAKYFFFMTQRRPTPATLKQTIGQAKTLLNNNFTEEEIRKGIEWCCIHSPPRGFVSLGWLSYDLENIVIKLKAKQAKEEIKKKVSDLEQISSTIDEQIKHQAKTSGERVKGFDFNMFEDD